MRSFCSVSYAQHSLNIKFDTRNHVYNFLGQEQRKSTRKMFYIKKFLSETKLSSRKDFNLVAELKF